MDCTTWACLHPDRHTGVALALTSRHWAKRLLLMRSWPRHLHAASCMPVASAGAARRIAGIYCLACDCVTIILQHGTHMIKCGPYGACASSCSSAANGGGTLGTHRRQQRWAKGRVLHSLHTAVLSLACRSTWQRRRQHGSFWHGHNLECAAAAAGGATAGAAPAAADCTVGATAKRILSTVCNVQEAVLVFVVLIHRRHQRGCVVVVVAAAVATGIQQPVKTTQVKLSFERELGRRSSVRATILCSRNSALWPAWCCDPHSAPTTPPVTFPCHAPVGGSTFLTKMKIAFSGLSLMRLRIT
jgi:hypothetical protein